LTPLSEFFTKLNQGNITKAAIGNSKIYFLDKNNIIYQTFHTHFPKSELFNRLM
jgi:hypothetical protein